MKKIYLSGPMTGIKDLNYPLFNEWAKYFRSKGYVVYNPAEIENSLEKTRRQCMRECIEMILLCDSIFMIDGWRNSKGATLERDVAIELGLELISLDSLDQ